MAYSSKRQTTIFEIQTRDISTFPKRASLHLSNIRQMKHSQSTDAVSLNLMSDEISLAVRHDDQTDPLLKTITFSLKISIAIKEKKNACSTTFQFCPKKKAQMNKVEQIKAYYLRNKAKWKRLGPRQKDLKQ